MQMNVERRVGILALAIIFGSQAYGQSSMQPGEPASSDSAAATELNQPIYMSPTGELPVSPLRSSRISSGPHDRSAMIWKISIATMLAASALDAASSMGKNEQNPLLRSSDGTFGAKGVAVKFSLMGAAVVPQIIFRNRKDLRKIFTVINVGDTALFTTIGIHNLGVKTSQ
jgi:hypothetical protein